MKKRYVIYILFAYLISISTAYSMITPLEEEKYALKNRVKTFSDEKETNIITSYLYKIRPKKSEKVLDGGNLIYIDVKNSLNLDQDFSMSQNYKDQVWTLIEVPEYPRHYIVKSMNGYVLDGGFGTPYYAAVIKSLHTPNDSNYTRQLWTLKESNYRNFYFLKSKKMHDSIQQHGPKVLSLSTNGDNVEKDTPLLSNQTGYENQIWEFVPVNYRLSGTIKDFKYGPAAYDLNSLAKNVSFVAWTASNNKTDTSDIHHVSIEQKCSNISSWFFSKSEERDLLLQHDVNIEAEYCGVKASSHSNPIKWERRTKILEESKEVNSEDTVVKLVSDITVPPGKKVEYEVTWRKVDADIPFNAHVTIEGSAHRLKKDESTPAMEQLDADAVMALLPYTGYNGTSISKDDKNNISGTISGVVRVKGAITGSIETKYTRL